ncbi:MAG: 3-deoxy-D-manno-octulosonic acid transferase [Gammaproteobacteria bacterium]|nr:3-deoxy-D-manno-octulosonic acid transferase [Gammaproteobacteria bacterium]
MRLIYSALTTIILPFALIRLLIKSRRNKDYRKRITERLSFNLPDSKSHIWIHAVSVGELLAVLPLIKELQKANQSLLVTTTTPTGSAMVRKKLGNTVSHCYLPFDHPVLVKRFLQHTTPLATIFIETEIWPNYLHYLKKQSTPTLLINARLSERSFRSYYKFGNFARKTLQCFTEVACQNKESQKRFTKLGAKACTLGNLKFDISIPVDLSDKKQALQKQIGKQPFILAASTHKGEDEIIINAFKRSYYAGTHKLIIAPRHPERCPEVSHICKSQGFTYTLYSHFKQPIKSQNKIIIIDTLGDLLYFYALADIAIIGGSFIEHGGHNPLEAALFSTPCITGPYYFNFETLVTEMLKSNAIIVSSSEKILQQKTDDMTQIGKNAKVFFDRNQGSLLRYKELILSELNR